MVTQEKTMENRFEKNEATTPGEGVDFIRTVVNEHMRTGKYHGQVITRFPPEPNGYPHIGHAKSICLNFGIAQDYGGRCHLRMDDTNPTTEDEEYVKALQDAVHWLGFDWGQHMYYASDYFGRLYEFAEQLILDGKAYVDSLTEEEIRDYRGTVTEPGRESPYRQRSVAENLDLLRRMKAGEFPDGAHVLRAKGDMASPNMKMRDPLLYRIRHAHHYRTGDEWCILLGGFIATQFLSSSPISLLPDHYYSWGGALLLLAVRCQRTSEVDESSKAPPIPSEWQRSLRSRYLW